MVAQVFSLMITDFIKYPNADYDIDVINGVMTNIQNAINGLIAKIRSRGYAMDDIVLDKITNITQVSNVLNKNIDKINQYFSALNKAFEEQYMLSKEVLETMKIEVLNKDSNSMVVVYEDKIDVELNNGQVVSIKRDTVTSKKGDDIKTITHD